MGGAIPRVLSHQNLITFSECLRLFRVSGITVKTYLSGDNRLVLDRQNDTFPPQKKKNTKKIQNTK